MQSRQKLLAALLAVAVFAPLNVARADDAKATTAKPADAKSTESLPAAKEVLEKYITATGGRDAYEKHKSRTVVGKLALPAQNITGTMTAITSAPNKAHITQDLSGIGKIEQGFDGETLWELSPMSGVRLIEGDEKAAMVGELTFNSELQPDKLYQSAETVGVKDIDGKPAYDVKLVANGSGKESHSFFDKESGLLVERDATLVSPAGEMQAVTKLGEYKEFDGIKFPALSTTTVAGTTFTVTTESVEHDKPLPEGTFDLPEDVKKLKAKTPATQPAK